jgi:hypothetical protein
MKTFLGILGVIVGFFVILAVFAALGFLGQSYQLALYGYFAPRYANVERNVYENTHSYNAGMTQTLYDMMFAYNKTTDPNSKIAMRGVYLHTVADYNESKLPFDLQSFTEKLKQDELSGK